MLRFTANGVPVHGNAVRDEFVRKVRELPHTPRLPVPTGSAASIPGMGQSAIRVQVRRDGGLRMHQVKRAGSPRRRGWAPRNPNMTGNTDYRLAMRVGYSG